MAEEKDSSQEKTEEPTEKRKKESRDKGQIARSKELSTTVVLLAGAIGMLLSGPTIFARVGGVFTTVFSAERGLIYDKSALPILLQDLFVQVLYSLIPLFFLLLMATFIGAVALGGWIFSMKSLAPKFSKMNPLEGFKRMFSVKGLMELLKALAKFVLIGAVSILLVNVYLSELLFVGREPLFQGIKHGSELVLWIYILICSATAFVAVVDVPFQVWQQTKQLRMTKQQVKDEMKDSEGKPEVKSRIRQAQMEMAQKRMMAAVPEADVVITNPTHYSVALKYNGTSMAAPVVVAKGVGFVALKIREIATEHNITIVEIPALARSIYHSTPIDKEIPMGLYVSVAQVLAYVYQLDLFAKGRGPLPDLQKDFDIPDDLVFDE